MQSLKSTAFAVTLLAIASGLYFVSSDNTAPETVQDDLIKIDSSLSTAQQGSMTMPSYDLNSQTAPMQISTGGNANLASNGSGGSLPSLSTPELPKLQTPNLNLPTNQFSNSSPASPSTNKPQSPTLPSFSGSQSQSNPGNQLLLPEIATRQPVSTAPTTRDDGLIDALKTNDFNPRNAIASNDNGFKTNPPASTNSPLTSDNSFNSQASAVAKDEEANTVKSADGTLGSLSMPDFKRELSTNPVPVSIASVWTEVDRLIAADEYRKALGVLSKHYGRKGLTGPQEQKLQGWLDALAGKVIYSTEHHFVRKPYLVKRGETLESISRQFKVPGEVIYNINRAQFGLTNEVTPGMELKIVNGPFHAEVDLEEKMLTLFVKNLYAGRFPVAVGISGKPDAGNHKVMIKSPNGFTWRDAAGKEYPPSSPGNGYGPYWIGLTGSLCIHAVPSGTPHGHRGCIGLSEKDAKDVYGILSKESQISIVR
ncbi:L,D-transpeptidase family protein [Mariniblastus fucicola]|uniref:L,D-transpeptidase YkuD n=1 Tax=Mariniblastus fucicola TaxID=980251 RepID=A0A5B9P5D9_9BACT|nr:L,D-transpeptidase family protein [Mariniblastus fucicola]QEG20192.1 Putative L,D-transpeptidase YkuD [Mariniblastus fucicola]